jgi:beta-RFAP synthase
MGLGTGTQLALAVARALAAASGRDELDATELAWRVGRGQRSALGVHGFERGGLLVEAGKRGGQTLGPLVARAAFPEEWRVLLVLPPWGQGLHGVREIEAFEQVAGAAASDRRTDRLCRLILLNMLPSLAESDAAAFGEAVYEYNRRVGEVFRPVQGGVYAHPRTGEVVGFLHSAGIRGVGQSSWGPGIFAVVADAEQAEDLRQRTEEEFGLSRSTVLVTRGCNHGATWI